MRRISNIIKQIRRDRFETQKSFAESTKLPLSNIKAWETNRSLPNAENIQKLSSFVKEYDEKTAAELLEAWKKQY